MNDLFSRRWSRDAVKETSTAWRLIYSCHFTRFALFCCSWKREPNDNNVRLRSLIPFVLCLCIQSSKPKKNTPHVFISTNFSVHFLSFLFFLFIARSFSVFTSNYPFIVTFWHFHSSISHWNCYCYCYLISHSQSIWVRHEMPSRCARKDKGNLDRLRQNETAKKSKDFNSQAWNPNRCSYHSTSASTFQSQFSVYRLNSVDILDNIYKVELVCFFAFVPPNNATRAIGHVPKRPFIPLLNCSVSESCIGRMEQTAKLITLTIITTRKAGEEEKNRSILNFCSISTMFYLSNFI